MYTIYVTTSTVIIPMIRWSVLSSILVPVRGYIGCFLIVAVVVVILVLVLLSEIGMALERVVQ